MIALRSSYPAIFLLLVSAQIIRAKPDPQKDAGESTIRPPQDVGESSTSKDAVSATNVINLVELSKMLESDEDQVIIWKVENGKAVQTELIRAEFEGDMTYIIIKGKPKVKSEEWLVFYWIGGKSPDANAGVTALLTVRLDAIVHNTIRIYREYEGLESRIFRDAFKEIGGNQDKSEAKSDSMSTADEEFNAEAPRAYLIKKIKEEIRLKSVAFSLHYVDEKDICLLLVSDDVCVYCGSATSESLRKISQKLGQVILHTKPSDTKLVTLNRSGSTWSQLQQEEQELLEDFAEKFDQYGTEEIQTVDQIFPAKEKSEGLAIIRVHEEDDGVMSHEHIAKDHPMLLSSLMTDDCYVIVTGENCAVIVWMGTRSEINEREESAKTAELYLKDKNLSQATPVRFVDQETIDVPAEAHLGDFIRFLSQFDGSLLLQGRNDYDLRVSA